MHYDIVIIGGGAGGLELAAMLGRKLGATAGRSRVLLVDRSPVHIWKPTLHEVAAGTLDAHQEGLSYTILARHNHFSYTPGELRSLDLAQRQITLGEMRSSTGAAMVPERSIGFRWAVLAIGSGSNFFGTPGAEHAFVLEQASDAEHFRKHLSAAFTRATFSPARSLNVAIVGGGATGVELSAELLEAHHEMQDNGPEQRFALNVSIVEAAPRILGGLPERISAQAQVALERKHVRVMTGTKVIEIQPDRLITSAGEVPADLIVWAAGIKAAEHNTTLGLAVNRAHQFEVNERLETSAPGVYALGDCAACPWRDGKTVPARAQAAHQQASYLCDVLVGLLRENPVTQPFRYRDFGSLVSLGDNKGVGNLMGGLGGRNFFVEGLLAKYMYMSLHLMHHRAILGLRGTALMAMARLLQRRVSGRLKLH